MTKLSDKEIQEMLENSDLSGFKSQENIDLKAYQTIFNDLNKKPAEGLALGFSKRVVNRIQAKLDRRIALGWYVVIALVIAGVSVPVYFYLSYTDPDGASIYSGIFSKYKWVLLFGLGCFLLIEYLDRKLVRD